MCIRDRFGTYVRVGNAAEAYELLQKNRNNKIVGGGIWMRLGSRRVATAIDLSACGLDQIEETETEFRIGAMCTPVSYTHLRRGPPHWRARLL